MALAITPRRVLFQKRGNGHQKNLFITEYMIRSITKKIITFARVGIMAELFDLFASISSAF